MKPRLIVALFAAAIMAAAPMFADAQTRPDATYNGPTIGPAPPIQCVAAESIEWRPTPGCGSYGDVPGWIPGEHRCYNYYDPASNRCQRRCEWTGNCREP
jgi:hypothetical protein